MATGCLLGAAGLLCASAFSPWHMFPALFVSFSLLVSALSLAKGLSKAFFYGWVFGTGYFVGGLYWLEYPFVIAGLGSGAGFAAVVILSATLGLLVASVCLLCKLKSITRCLHLYSVLGFKFVVFMLVMGLWRANFYEKIH